MRVAVLEDDFSARQKLIQFFSDYAQSKKQAIETSYFQSPGPFLEEYKSQYDLILLDIQMPEMNGMKAAEQQTIPVVVVAALMYQLLNPAKLLIV